MTNKIVTDTCTCINVHYLMRHYKSISYKKKTTTKLIYSKKSILTVIQILASSLSFVAGSILVASPRPVNSNITSEKTVENFLVVLEQQTHNITGLL